MKNELCSLNFESFYRNRIQEKRIWYQTNFAWEKKLTISVQKVTIFLHISMEFILQNINIIK